MHGGLAARIFVDQYVHVPRCLIHRSHDNPIKWWCHNSTVLLRPQTGTLMRRDRVHTHRIMPNVGLAQPIGQIDH